MSNRTALIARLTLLFCLLLQVSSVTAAAELKNRLADHPSPYLELHGRDPVAWQEWNSETVERARQEGKLLYLSVGYFSCHWCHVMQRESYQDKGIAALLNASFVPVKIDRELEPALDERLMDFAQRTLGRGGWPLNVFITPRGYPVYAVLYMPPDNFRALLLKLDNLWKADPEKLSNLVRREAVTRFPDAPPQLDAKRVAALIEAAPNGILRRADTLAGGFGQQNKFPSVAQLQFLLERQRTQPDEELAAFLRLTLDAMASRGLRDHLDGGFFRYSTDPNWEIPHFEKMLYDNAALARLYLRAAEVFDAPEYRALARDTLDFMQWRMLADEGGLVGSFSAVDKHEVEGGYYLWTHKELQELLSEDEYKIFVRAWDMDHPAELEAGNLPRRELGARQLAEESGKPQAEIEQILQSARTKLLAVREKRVLPVDDKLLAGWNGLALSAFAEAAGALNDDSYRATARGIRDFLGKRMYDGETLSRALAKGRLLGSASLQDYAYVSRGLLDWAQLTGAEEDYRLALRIAQQGWQRFYRNNAWYQEDSTLLAPPSGEEIVTEGATPSPPAMLIRNSLLLASHFDDPALRDRALSALNRQYDPLEKAPFWFVSRLDALRFALSEQN
ncbi:MAG: DUF255 domain-containing protein [Pseudomonadota bacterium]|nr:DUF255 domain-containing protein [Pseudomonadota bacterium]